MKEMGKLEDTRAKFPYEDILYLEHPEPKNHKRQPKEMRAGQFSPFAALTGYGEQVKETERYTSGQIFLDEERKDILDQTISMLKEKSSKIVITYFSKDEKKQGGEYLEKQGTLKKIDRYRKEIIFTDNTRIKIDSIVNINVNKL